jgi:hypothetical protein
MSSESWFAVSLDIRDPRSFGVFAVVVLTVDEPFATE